MDYARCQQWLVAQTDLIEQDVNGLLVPLDDVDALHDTLLRVIADPALAKRLGEVARTRVIKDYELSVTADRLRALYDSLIAAQH